MNATDRDTLVRVLNTLNQITVSGADNLDKLLGCILAVRKILDNDAQTNAQPGNAQPGESGHAQPEIMIEPVIPE